MIRRSTLLVALIAVLLLMCCRSSADGPPFGRVSFSPDGKLVVFPHQERGGCFLYIGDLGTQVARRLTKSQSGCENDPDFSSDGKLIVYAYAPGSDRKSSLFVVNADGSSVQQITKTGTDDVFPVFSRDNKLVYFARSGRFGHSSPIAASRQHDFDLFSVNLGSGAVTQLTQQSLYDLLSVSMSPDGKDLLITTYRYPIGALFEIYAIDKPQSARLVFQPHVPDEPKLVTPAFADACYLPNELNALIIAASSKDHSYDYNVYLMSVVTGSFQQLTNLTGLTPFVQTSPDGKAAIIENQDKLYLLDLQSHGLRPLVWKGLGT